MSHAHHGQARHAHAAETRHRHAEAASPTLSLLRWSAASRVAAATGLLVLLWALVLATLSS